MLVRGRRERWTAITFVVLLLMGVACFVYVLSRPDWQAHAIVAISAESDSPVIEVVVLHAQCSGRDPRVRLDESTAGTVRIAADYDGSGGCDDIGLETPVLAELEAPLGERTIQASSLGRPIVCVVDGQPSDICG